MDLDPCARTASFKDVVTTPHGELNVYRCESDWYVHDGRRDARSRYLDEAFEYVLGGRLDHATLRSVVEMLDRGLAAQGNRSGKPSASHDLRAAG